MSRTRVRPAVQSDLAVISALQHRVNPSPWSAEGLRAELDRPLTRGLVAEQDGAVVGYAVVLVVADEAELLDIGVDPERRRAGIGAELLRAVVETARQAGGATLHLEVRETNAAARALYAGLGFIEAHRRPGYYRPGGETALVLRKTLAPGAVDTDA